MSQGDSDALAQPAPKNLIKKALEQNLKKSRKNKRKWNKEYKIDWTYVTKNENSDRETWRTFSKVKNDTRFSKLYWESRINDLDRLVY
jgi:hypothetical protein